MMISTICIIKILIVLAMRMIDVDDNYNHDEKKDVDPNIGNDDTGD